MKKILIAFSLMIFSLSSFSQISGGLFGGTSLTWFGVESKIQSSEGVGLGYNFGAMADFPISDNFVFTGSVKYNAVTGHMHYDHGVITNIYDQNMIDTVRSSKKITYTLNYLEIPVGFKGKTNEIGFMSYYMKAGVAPMIRLKGIADITDEGDDLFTDNIGLFNMNWFMGAGFEWSLSGNTRFITEIVYNGGIADFIKTNDATTVEVYQEDGTTREHRGKINSVALKVGILF
jgi:hypothetical protein